MLASFQSAGRAPFSIELSKILESGEANCSASSFRSFADNPSGPGDLVGCSCLMVFLNVSVANDTVLIVSATWAVCRCSSSLNGGSSVYTDIKKFDKRIALSKLAVVFCIAEQYVGQVGLVLSDYN